MRLEAGGELVCRVDAPHFCAGFVLERGKDGEARVSVAAPILAYMRGWTARQVKGYCDRKGWKVERCGVN